MALSVLRGRGPRRAPASVGLPIGDDETKITGCPVCGRPIVVGAGQCPGCGTRLLLGVPARRAGIFVVLGVALGMWIGGAVAMSVLRPAVVAPAGGATQSGNGSAVPAAGATAAPPAPSVDPAADVPPDAVAALAQLPATDGRLMADAMILRSVVPSRSADSFAIADALRSVASDAAFGSDLATRLVGWPAAADVRSDLVTFYDGVRDACRVALSTSVQDTTGYRTAGWRVNATMNDLARVDGRARALAASIGIEVAPVAPATAAP